MIPQGRTADKYHGGVPADRFAKWEGRWGPPTFRDPAIAAVAAVAYVTQATMSITDDCTDCGEFTAEHFGPTTNGTTTKPWNGAASRFTDEQYKMSAAACDPGSGTDDGPTIKAGCFLVHHEPGGVTNVNGVHAAAQRVSSLKDRDTGAVSKAKAHLRAHYTALKEDPPDSIKASGAVAAVMKARLEELGQIVASWDAEDVTSDPLAAQFAALHEQTSGTHSHPHSSYGSQGSAVSHEHSHTHEGDNLHRHDHPTSADGGRRLDLVAAVKNGFRVGTPEGRHGWWGQVQAGLAFIAGGAVSDDPLLGSPWAAFEQGDGTWQIVAGQASGITAAASVPVQWAKADSYADAVDQIGRQLAQQIAEGDNPALLSDTWRSELAFEGLSTGDGRFIEPGALQYRPTPLPLMLQTETAGGHDGAVLAGFITAAGKVGNVAVGTGSFLACDAGRQFVQIINGAGRFGISIDVADAEGGPQCPTHGTDLEQCDPDCDWEIHFTLILVMGASGTPFPAFQDAYIELATPPAQLVAAGGDTRVHVGAGEAGEALRTGGFARADTIEFTAEFAAAGTAIAPSTAAVAPPAGWFAPPWTADGTDPSEFLIRQPSGGFACPLTVDPPDENGLRRVYGHVADRLTCHTGILDRCQVVPHSRTGYAAFNLRPVMTAEGDLVKVGHLTMGVGHALLDPNMSVEAVRDHYDGGPGAIRMAHVAAGDDEHGPWVAGYVDPARSDAQVDEFAGCSLSGDWREVWRGKGLEMVACLAGVTVPGFPISAAAQLVAAGVHLPAGPQIGEMRVGYRNGEPVALVAAGIVRQPMPWERQTAALAQENEKLRRRLDQAEASLVPLRPLAAERLQARFNGKTFAAPTAQDSAITEALKAAVQALHDAMVAQMGDPDSGDDPDDARVAAHLEDAKDALDRAVLDQARDESDESDETGPSTGAAAPPPGPPGGDPPGSEAGDLPNVVTLKFRENPTPPERPSAVVVLPEPATR